MIENFISSIEHVGDTIATLINLLVASLKNILYLLSSFLEGVTFTFEALAALPPFFFPTVAAVIAIMIITRILGRDG